GEGAQVDGRDCESCNVYNMLKLSRRLFSFRPDGQYADYMEREMFNHALASFDPNAGQMAYMVPVGRAVQQEYQNMLDRAADRHHVRHLAGVRIERRER